MGRPNAFDGMLHECCVGLGWCGTVKHGEVLHITQFIPEEGPVTAEEFAAWVIRSDGIDLGAISRAQRNSWMQQLKTVFIQHMGADVIDAKLLRSGFNDA